MKEAAKMLEFEIAAQLRDQIKALENGKLRMDNGKCTPLRESINAAKHITTISILHYLCVTIKKKKNAGIYPC